MYHLFYAFYSLTPDKYINLQITNIEKQMYVAYESNMKHNSFRHFDQKLI